MWSLQQKYLCQPFLLCTSYCSQSNTINSFSCLSASFPLLLPLPPLKEVTRPLETWVRIPLWKRSSGTERWWNMRLSFVSRISEIFPRKWNTVLGLVFISLIHIHLHRYIVSRCASACPPSSYGHFSNIFGIFFNLMVIATLSESDVTGAKGMNL